MVPITFYRNAYCEVLLSDVQWYRSTIQGGPYVGNNGAAYYKVHMHHPINRHDMVWATNIRPYPTCEGSYSDDHYASFPQPNVPHVYAASQAIAVPMSAGINQFGAQKSSSNRPLTPLAPAAQSVVPSKRPLEREQQAVASTPGTRNVQPTRPAANNDATLAPGEVSAAGTVAEPPAKRPALLPKEKTPTAHIAGWNDSNSPPTHKKAAPTLLEGPAVKVQVKGILQSKTWYLPQALMSHFSPFIKTTLQNAANASSMLSTQLNGCEPTGFATYVHWMYYGAYDPQHGSRAAYETDSIDAWVLGDRLKVPIFQNLAMSHIYSRYVGSDNHRPLTTSMVQYVCAKTTTNSLLRLLYLDVLTQNFTNQALVKGTLEEWDVALQEHPDARLALLGSFRTQGSRVKSKEEYLVAGVSLDPSRDARSTTAFEPRRLQVNLSALPRIKSEIKKEPEES